MIRIALALAAMLTSAPAAAQTLWENIESGMSLTQVRALYPAGNKVRHRPDRTTIGDVALTPECKAEVHILHRRGQVDAVVMRGQPAIFARCGAAVLDEVMERYGQPLSVETGRPSMLKRVRTTYLWSPAGVHVRFVSFSTEGWGGAGLGNASWEMSLSSSPEAPQL